jgi:hypothetical protein
VTSAALTVQNLLLLVNFLRSQLKMSLYLTCFDDQDVGVAHAPAPVSGFANAARAGDGRNKLRRAQHTTTQRGWRLSPRGQIRLVCPALHEDLRSTAELAPSLFRS